ncbi:hypothetical protein RRF57_008364 [Xylaria bambusicola]|uniref:Uncharacterized protein n=1 Tax=Xylaria bambusicola TaxID=326684 RepID=A0AAN7UHM0_9PEZI
MHLDGHTEDEDMLRDHDYVYTADLQVEETRPWDEADIEAGSPASLHQRRRIRAQTMRLRGNAGMYTPTHVRGSSDTTSTSTLGRTELRAAMTTGFTSINAPRALYGEHMEARGMDGHDSMRID